MQSDIRDGETAERQAKKKAGAAYARKKDEQAEIRRRARELADSVR